jgi:hypothetical protein
VAQGRQARRKMDEAGEKALDRIHEHKRHYDIIYVYRFNYAMVAQSMLLVSHATLLSVVNKTPQSHIAQVVIAAFGLLFTFFQYVISLRLDRRMRHLNQNYLLKYDPVYRDAFNDAYSSESWLVSNVQGVWMPASFALVWCIFIGVAISEIFR